jgi:8-oxo-dGTP diphosphatase
MQKRSLELTKAISPVKVYDAIPAGFTPQMEIAAVYVSVDEKILLLQLSDHKPEKGLWGLPAGKLETREGPLQAAKRELFEETGINIESERLFQSLGALYFRKPEVDYVCHLFGVNLSDIPPVCLSHEHCSYVWVSREEAEVLPLMNGGKEALDFYYHILRTWSGKG